MDEKKQTASYRVISDAGGKLYQFFCELSGALCCTVGPVSSGEKDELQLAWEKGQQYFNQCHRCGKWVCDAMFNADVLECVDCAPWEESPRYCSKCGEKITAPATYCCSCGARLRYGEVWK